MNARSSTARPTGLQLALAKDDLKPSVDLALTLGLAGDDRSSNRAFSNVFEPERSAWQAGLSITYPLGRVGEKARFRQATRAQTRDELAVHKLEQDVLVAVRESVRSVQTNQEAVKIVGLASNLAQEQYEAEIEPWLRPLHESPRARSAEGSRGSACSRAASEARLANVAFHSLSHRGKRADPLRHHTGHVDALTTAALTPTRRMCRRRTFA